MGKPNDITGTKADRQFMAWEAWVERGEIKSPKMPIGCDAELILLQLTQDAFRRGNGRFRGFVELGSVVPRQILSDYQLLIASKLGRTYDARVVMVLDPHFFWSSKPGEKNSTKSFCLMLSSTGRWIVYLPWFDGTQMYVLNDSTELMYLINVQFKEMFGTLHHFEGVEVDAKRINWHLTATMQESRNLKERDLNRDDKVLEELNAARIRAGCKPL